MATTTCPGSCGGRALATSAGWTSVAPLPAVHTDVPRLLAGGVGGVFFAAYVPYSAAERGLAARMTLEQIDLIHRMVGHAPELQLALTADDVVRIHIDGVV